MIRLQIAGLVALVLLALPGQAHAAASEPKTARLLIAATVRAQASSESKLVTVVAASRPLTGQQTALPVLSERRVGDKLWLRVRLPGRPIGRTGWVSARNVRLEPAPWRVVVVRSARLASVYRNGKLFKRYPVVVGKPSTPTPAGHFFIAEHIRQDAGSELGPWALATSAYSNVLQEFDGGPGQIGLHGRAGELAVAPLGTAASHGCIRFENDAIRRLAGLLSNGAPIDII